MSVLRAYVVLCLFAILLTGVCAQEDAVWSVNPAYETKIEPTETDLSFNNSEGDKVTLYSESHAVLIIQGAYRGSWSPALEGAETSQRLLVKALEERKFHVLVWKDLDSDDLDAVVKDVAANYSESPNARLFFYYFGHGVTRTSIGTGQPSFFLVPVDAPSLDEKSFVSKAVSGSTLVAYFDALGVKHGFFAFEACRSGGIMNSLGSLGENEAGYLVSNASRTVARQYLTAGTELEDIPADAAFSAALVGALSSKQADSNGDNYITGTEAAAYVAGTIPKFDKDGLYTRGPEYRRYPGQSNGDFIFGPYDPNNFSPFIKSGSSVGLLRPSLEVAFEAIVAQRYETAERNIQPFLDSSSPDGALAMAALESARGMPEKKVLPYIAKAAMLGQIDAQRIIGIIRLSRDSKIDMMGDLISEDDPSGFYADDLIAELTQLDQELAGLADVEIEKLADAGDPFSMMILHHSEHKQQLQEFYDSISDDGETDRSPPEEQVSEWLRKAAALGYAPAKSRLALLQLGIDVSSPWDHDIPRPESLPHRELALLAEAAADGYRNAVYLLTRWRSQSNAPFPGLTDDRLIELGDRVIDQPEDQSKNPISADDFFLIDQEQPRRIDQLAAQSDLFVSIAPPRLDLAASRLAELTQLITESGFDQSFYSEVYGRFFEAEGNLREALERYKISSEAAESRIANLLRVGAALGWDADLHSLVEEAIKELDCTYSNCAEIVDVFVRYSDGFLAQELARAMRKAIQNDGQFPPNPSGSGDTYKAYATITDFVLNHENGFDEVSFSVEDLRPFFEAAVKKGHSGAALWLEKRGFEVPLSEERISGQEHENWQFVRFQDEVRGMNCYVTSQEPLRLSGSPDRKPNLIVYTFGEAPKVGLLQYNANMGLDPEGAIEAEWDIDNTLSGAVSDAKEGRMTFGGHNAEMVMAMVKGKVVTIKFVGDGGQHIADTYSLFGFTEAYRDMVQECPNMTSALQ
ncbi:MAG: peptidase caspase family protein [Devosia sp.]|nr:peptidase caspase family protein [Devosia sp.]